MKFETAKLVYFYDKMLDLVLSGLMAAIDNTYDEECFLILDVRTMAGDFMGSRTVRVSELFATYDECVDNKNAYKDDIKESQDKNKDIVFDWEYLCTNYINIDVVVDCILCNEWEDYDNLNDLEDITCHMLDLFKISIKERLKTEGYDDASIAHMLKELTKENL